MASADWNTIASDLQRAVNNLAWFVLESMTIPEQPQMTSWPLMPAPMPPLPPTKPAREDQPPPKKKRSNKDVSPSESLPKKPCIGEQIDRLVAETLV